MRDFRTEGLAKDRLSTAFNSFDTVSIGRASRADTKYISNNSSAVSTTMITTIRRLVASSAPTKSPVGVRLITSHGRPKLSGIRVNDALNSAPVRGERKRNSFWFV